MTKVLWFSRHQMGEEQLADLRRIFGEDVEVKQVSASVSSWKDVAEAGSDCDVLGVVLPPALLADLVNPRNNQKMVIRSVMKRVPTGRKVPNPATGLPDDEFAMIFEAWEQVKKIEVITERL